jgi:hypothetical protein
MQEAPRVPMPPKGLPFDWHQKPAGARTMSQPMYTAAPDADDLGYEEGVMQYNRSL